MAKLILENIRSLLPPISALKEKWASSLTTALDRTQMNLERLNGQLSDLETRLNSTSPSTQGLGVVVKWFFLTADFTVPIPDEPAGTVVLYLFRQDSIGSHTVTWPAVFIGMYGTTSVSFTANSLSSYAFAIESATNIIPVLTGLSDVL